MVLQIRPEQIEQLQASDEIFAGWYVGIIMFDWRDPASFRGGFRFRTPSGFAELRAS